MTLTHVPQQPLYLRPRPQTYFYSLSNVLNYHALMYLARSIASNQAYSQLLSRSVTNRNNISKRRDPYRIPIGISIILLSYPSNTILVERPIRKA